MLFAVELIGNIEDVETIVVRGPQSVVHRPYDEELP